MTTGTSPFAAGGGGPASTNCGENARFTRTTLESRGSPIVAGIVIQDPTMQRRTDGYLRPRVWQGPRRRRPVVELSPAARRCWSRPMANWGSRAAEQELWPVTRYPALLLGELPRLQDTP